MRDRKLLGSITRDELLRNEAFVRYFMENKPQLNEGKKTKWKWGKKGRVPYYVRKLNSIFNID